LFFIWVVCTTGTWGNFIAMFLFGCPHVILDSLLSMDAMHVSITKEHNDYLGSARYVRLKTDKAAAEGKVWPEVESPFEQFCGRCNGTR
jgi:hypothetical protein